MECTCVPWSFFLLYAINILSTFVSTKPNIFDLSRTRGTSLRAANQLSSLSKKDTFFLRSVDPLSTHSPRNAGIRLGRSLSESGTPYRINHEISGYASDSDTKYNYLLKSMTTNMYSQEDVPNHLLRVSPCNISTQTHVIAELPSEKESDAIVKPNYANVRYIRAINEGTRRVRKSKGTGTSKFLRFGKAMAFNRYDRGNDNFMRFGRSGVSKKLAGNFRQFDGIIEGIYLRSLRREPHVVGVDCKATEEESNNDKNLERKTRKSDSFLRFGRPSHFLVQHTRASSYTDERDSNRNDAAELNDMNLHSKYYFVKQPLQSSKTFSRLGRISPEKCVDTDDNFVDSSPSKEHKGDSRVNRGKSIEWSERERQGLSESSSKVKETVCNTPQTKRNPYYKFCDEEVSENQLTDDKCEGYECCRSTKRSLIT